MGEPGDEKLYEERAITDLPAPDTKRDAQTARADQNAYRTLVVQRFDLLIEAVNKNTMATAMLAKEIRHKNGTPEPTAPKQGDPS